MTNHMWDGFWFLANGRAWEGARRPQDHRRQDINAPASTARGRRKAQRGLQRTGGQGLDIQQAQCRAFRDKLRAAGFYAEWKGKYGEQAWDLLEKSVGKLAGKA